MELAPIFRKAYWSLAFFGLLYVLGMISLTFPDIQRAAVYMHKVDPSKYHSVDDVEYFGFLKSQVQPFQVVTPDNETLYAWHVLPLHLCEDNEHDISSASSGPPADAMQTHAFKLLAKNPDARVLLNLHGNAASIGSGYRPQIYRNMVSISTPSHPVHVIAFDYRGFGQSTGTPTEEGLITDAVAVINFLTSPPLSIPHSRIVIAGESLGTAVAAGVVERIALGSSSSSGEASASEPFAGVFLFAPFRNVQELLDSYSFMGLLPPLFAPLMAQPRLKNYMISTIVDRWDTASRLARLTGISSPGDEKLITSISYKRPFDLTIFHAVNDYDIPWREGQRTWEAAVGGNEASALGTFVADSVSEDGVAQVKVWERYGSDGKAVARVVWQRLRYGGHNQIASLPLAAVAVKRAFERATAEN